jgi:RHS repeat-associated protein
LKASANKSAHESENPRIWRIHYYHNDHLGTPRELSGEAGEIQWAATYKAWGNTLTVEWEQTSANAHAQRNEIPAAQIETKADENLEEIYRPLRFQGQYYDNETGLHYNRFRYYDPDCGRFVSQDPIGLLGGINSFQYAPNASGWVDPSGLSAKRCKPCPCPPGTMDPNKIRFSQRTVTLDGKNGANTYAEDMATGKWDWARSGPLRVMTKLGGVVSYDNRRFLAARLSKQKCVPVQEVNPNDVHPDSTTGKTWDQQMEKRMNDRRNSPRVPEGGLLDLD